MLTIHTSHRGAPIAWQSGTSLPADAVWLDLHDPDPAERAFADAALGSPLPTREQISGIELSSRVSARDELLCLNIPTFVRAEGGRGAVTPLGFVLTPRLLVSQRYADSQAFDLIESRARTGAGPQSSSDALFLVIDTLVDVGADRMEHVATDLSELSRQIFAENRDQKRLLRRTLFQLGSLQRHVVQIRATVLGLMRVVDFLRDAPVPWIPESHYARLRTVLSDLQSLTEFDQQISDKVQFLLDAVLGFINIAQNEVMTVLTVVSVVTIPPMILAGIWGMNFQSMPEYHWAHGYAFALTTIGLSMLIPLLIFRWKKWV